MERKYSIDEIISILEESEHGPFFSLKVLRDTLEEYSKSGDPVNLSCLIGMHQLSGVGYVGDCNKDYGAIYESGWFVLDGVKYSVFKDPSDGYRSSMDKVCAKKATDKEMFINPPVKVLLYNDVRDDNNLYVIREVENGSVILSFGTANESDYYPYFVFDYTPENIGRKVN